MFELKTGMIVEFCDGDVGVMLNGVICCNDNYVTVNDFLVKDMFGEEDTICCAVKTVYKLHLPVTLNDLIDVNKYKKEDILWTRKLQLKEGDVFICTNLISAGVYHVNVNQYYLKTEDNIVMVDKSIIPYLKSDVKEIRSTTPI